MENNGQITNENFQPRSDIQFKVSAANGLTIFIGEGKIHYQFANADRLLEPKTKGDEMLDTTTFTMYRMDVELIGANKHAKVITEGKQDYYENYYTIGTEENGAKVFSYDKIIYKDIYPNIDWVLYTKEGTMKHEFVVKESGNPKDIKLKYSGATKLQLTPKGSIEATTPQGRITEQAPVSYTKEGEQVKSSFVLKENVLSYEVGNYEGTLVIDPTLIWATYYGGIATDNAKSVTTDAMGSVYITGYTNSVSNIATTGAYQTTHGGGAWDAFIAKFNNSGAIQWATYYGGTEDDDSRSITVDTANNVYITGYTKSASNIATPSSFQNIFGGTGMLNDAFVAKFNDSGIRVWSTYYGGTGDDVGMSIASDTTGNIYVTGLAGSSNLATTGAFQQYFGGNVNAFLVKFNNNGVRDWATYYGGTVGAKGYGVTTDFDGNVYLLGNTANVTDIATPGAYQTLLGGANDAFIAKFNSGGARQWATYFGGTSNDYGNYITTDNNGFVYMTGFTQSTSNIATANAYQVSNSGGDDVFLAKFDTGGFLLWSTYFGGADTDEGYGLVTNSLGDVYLTGYTISTSNISTPSSYQTTNNGGADAFISKFNGGGTLLWSSYYGGSNFDYGKAIFRDNNDNIFFTGYTQSPTNIATTGAYQSTISNLSQDAFLAKFDFSCSVTLVDSIVGANSLCLGDSVNLSNSTPGGIWTSNDTSVATINHVGICTSLNAGSTVIKYILTDACGSDTASKTVIVNPSPTPVITQLGTTLNVNSYLNYQWFLNGNPISGATNQNYLPMANGTYKVVVSDVNGCIGESLGFIVTNVSVNEIVSEQSFCLFPNPTKGLLTIKSLRQNISSVKIFNPIGCLLIDHSYAGKSEVSIDISIYPSGLYLIQCFSTEHNSKTIKINKD